MFAANGPNHVNSLIINGNRSTTADPDFLYFLQQLLYHVLITPRRNGSGVLKRTKLKATAADKVENSSKAATALPDCLCPDSFRETVNNLRKNDEITGDFQVALSNREVYEGSFLLRSRHFALPTKKPNPLRVSYLAPTSFKDLRNGMSPIDSLFSMSAFQWRGFKTERSIAAEVKRNPTMTTRIRDVLSKFIRTVRRRSFHVISASLYRSTEHKTPELSGECHAESNGKLHSDFEPG